MVLITAVIGVIVVMGITSSQVALMKRNKAMQLKMSSLEMIKEIVSELEAPPPDCVQPTCTWSNSVCTNTLAGFDDIEGNSVDGTGIQSSTSSDKALSSTTLFAVDTSYNGVYLKEVKIIGGETRDQYVTVRLWFETDEDKKKGVVSPEMSRPFNVYAKVNYESAVSSKVKSCISVITDLSNFAGKACPLGTYFKGFDNLGIMKCEPFPRCPANHYMRGFDDKGQPVCVRSQKEQSCQAGLSVKNMLSLKEQFPELSSKDFDNVNGTKGDLSEEELDIIKRKYHGASYSDFLEWADNKNIYDQLSNSVYMNDLKADFPEMSKFLEFEELFYVHKDDVSKLKDEHPEIRTYLEYKDNFENAKDLYVQDKQWWEDENINPAKLKPSELAELKQKHPDKIDAYLGYLNAKKNIAVDIHTSQVLVGFDNKGQAICKRSSLGKICGDEEYLVGFSALTGQKRCRHKSKLFEGINCPSNKYLAGISSSGTPICRLMPKQKIYITQ